MTPARSSRPPIGTTRTTAPAPTCSPVCTSPAAPSWFRLRWLPRSDISWPAPAGPRSKQRSYARSSQTVTIVDLELADYERMAVLVETYADFPLGTTDAALIAVAERLGITEIATLDRRHFHAVRPRHASAFALFP